MISITHHLAIDEAQLEWQFIRASGPGGQNVNKVSSAAQLRFNTTLLPEAVRQRLVALAGNRINSEGELIIEASVHRSQLMNRQDALDRLVDLLRQAAHVPKRRVATRPTRGSKERRLEGKRQRSHTKKLRQQKGFD